MCADGSIHETPIFTNAKWKFGKEIMEKKWIVPHAHFKGAPQLVQSPNEKKNDRPCVCIVTKTVHERTATATVVVAGKKSGDFWISSCWSTLTVHICVCKRERASILPFLFSTRPAWFSSIRLIVLFKHFLRRKVKSQKIAQKLPKCNHRHTLWETYVYAAVDVFDNATPKYSFQ